MRVGICHCFLLTLFLIHLSSQGKHCRPSKACSKIGGKCFPRKPPPPGYIETNIKCKSKKKGRPSCRCFKPLPSPCDVRDQKEWISLLNEPCYSNGEHKTLSGPYCTDGPKEKIGVVGAGMAGLTLSWILQYIGHEVVLLEASDRVGGRVHTYYSNNWPGNGENGWYGDLGAMRFPDNKTQPLTHAIINKFLGEDALDYFTNYNQGTGSYFYLNGKYYNSQDYWNDDQDVLKEIYGLFDIDITNPLLHNKTASNALINPSTVLQDKVLEPESPKWPLKACINPESLESYLRRRLKTLKGPQKMIDVWSVLLLQRAFMPMSLWEYLNDEPEEMEEKARIRRDHGDEGAQFQEIKNGTSQLPDAIFTNLTINGDFSYRPNSIVTGVTVSDNGKVNLHINGKEIEDEGYDKVIIATTSRAASLMTFNPLLPYDKTYALNSFHYMDSVKVFLHFTEPFWNSTTKIPRIPYEEKCTTENKPEQCGGTGTTDLSMRSIYYPSNTRHGTALLVSYVWGDDDAGRLTAIPEGALVQRALDDLAKIHGDVVYDSFIANDTSEYVIKKWLEDEYVGGGAFPWAYPFQDLHLLDALRLNTPPIYFAGEYTEKQFHGWIQAAVASACRVALEMFGISR